MRASSSRPEVLALIPARGGSKGLPRKNIRRVAGLPLIAYSIGHALEAQRITRVVVSTDDAEIARVARHYGAEVPFTRPAGYATDHASDFQVFEHALLTLDALYGYRPELVVQLRPTTPLRDVGVIDRAVATMLERPEVDSLKSVSLAEKSPYKMWRERDGRLVPVVELEGLPEAHSMPRQVLPTVYAANGYLDIVRPRAILEQGSMVGRVTLPLLIEEETFDLDHAEQLPGIERALLRADPRLASVRARISALPLVDPLEAT